MYEASYTKRALIWQGDRYKRRSPDNAYGAIVVLNGSLMGETPKTAPVRFFSRCVGKNEDGSNKYERLITFEPIEELKVEPIARKVEEILK